MAAEVGDPAPQFSLLGTGGKTYCLSDFRGHPLVLAFYPEDFSPICTAQLNSYSSATSDFQELNATVLGISPQSLESHDEFSRRLNLTFPLLADVDKEVAIAYDVLGPLGFYRRSVFVVDAQGVIRYAHRTRAGLSFRSSGELLDVVRSLQ
ncbi:peroxiredoxin Q/BCP [Ferrithrix thermotolerans DSM 19514]|jgi:peroxiredoxin Q/BCP|uniref:thioredoxin-dependent peroxiredoxin n=1 Tax=Ferrithrix thermotolerans DSM 19514 TaxID=1121881 RepID=A0A1M4SIF4_9ACTN|nr:peroxiredoxin [Ferrithrix thermotolerans]SHE31969.1 peroxiredoxin Q/BCP [Ferrithrix thermotolerans DSM 19514]